MAYWYLDAATGSDSAGVDGDEWASARASLNSLLTASDLGNSGSDSVAAGDIIFARANASETTSDSEGTITYSFPGTSLNPNKLIGCKTGTNREGASVVSTDISDRSVDQPVIENSGTMTLNGSVAITGVRFNCTAAALAVNPVGDAISLAECDIACQFMDVAGNENYVEITSCDIATTYSVFATRANGRSETVFKNCAFTTTGTTSAITNLYHHAHMYLIGCDVSDSDVNSIAGGGAEEGFIRLTNCKVPASYALPASAYTVGLHSSGIELIGCSNATSKGATDTYQDYEFENGFGTVDLESTDVRTGGADDQTDSGLFAYKMLAGVDMTMEGTDAAVKSPMMRVWVAGGSNTLTVYTTHEAEDLNEGDVWCEFFTPDDGDSTRHDFEQVPTIVKSAIGSTTDAGTDDTGSTWATSNTYKRKYSVTATAGYTGWAYAQVSYAKRYASTPKFLLVDPKIEVT